MDISGPYTNSDLSLATCTLAPQPNKPTPLQDITNLKNASPQPQA